MSSCYDSIVSNFEGWTLYIFFAMWLFILFLVLFELFPKIFASASRENCAHFILNPKRSTRLALYNFLVLYKGFKSILWLLWRIILLLNNLFRKKKMNMIENYGDCSRFRISSGSSSTRISTKCSVCRTGMAFRLRDELRRDPRRRDRLIWLAVCFIELKDRN